MPKEMKERWEKEIQRAKTAVSERGTVDSEGLITEKSLEIFHIPRAAREIELLSLADEADCVFEAMTALFLMSTREGEVRTGANLYAPGWGILTWNLEWDAKTKMNVWRLHQGLKIGCQDDLDFVIKLAYSFLRAEERDSAEKWAEYYVVNVRVLKEVLDNVKDLLNFQYRMEAEEEETRDINPRLLERVRLAMESAWPERIMNLKPGEPITYPVAGKTKLGVISPHCAGSWQGKKQAIVAAAIEGEAVIDGYLQKVPTASFIVRLPGQLPADSQVNLFVDQRFPIGSWVQVREENGRFYLIKTEEIPFDEDFFIEGGATIPIEGSWISEKRAEKARIVEWIEKDGTPIAILSPCDETDILSLGKRKGDTFKIKIHRVARDPVGKGGWIVGRTEEGFEIPIELREMSLSPVGPGLERIEGQTLNLTIIGFDESGLPQVSNVEEIIEDLRNLRKEIEESEKATKVSKRNFIDLPGFVVEINEEEEKAIVVVPRENGILHPFEVAQTYVPGGDLKNLRIGQEVTVRLFRRTDIDEIPLEYLTDEEIRSRPKHWRLQEERSKLLVPLCLEDKDLRGWPARPETIDFVKRHSWQYCLNAQIRVSFIAKAEISWSPIQYLRRSKDYDIHKITGRFIGRRGENIKSLISEEQARVEIRGFTITVRAQSEDARKIVCRRISKWFKDEFDISLKWVYSQNSEN